MRYASAVPLQADYFDERGIHKEYRSPAVQQPAMQQGSMNILRKVHNPNNATILSEDGIKNFYFSSYSRFSLYRISVHGSSNSISNRFFQHFRYVASERKQQFFEHSLQQHRYTTEIRAKQSLLRRNERNRRSERISEAFTIYKRSYNYFYSRQF